MNNLKLKIVWICHFTNEEVQSHISLWKKKDEFASWIPNLLKGFENCDIVEIHVISPHEYLKKPSNLLNRNIYYHFIPFGIPIWHRHWPRFFRFDLFTNYFRLRKRICRTVRAINPDLINLFGAENAYYSSSAPDLFNEFPFLVTIQGFISQFSDKAALSSEIRRGIHYEELILRTFKYYCGEQDSSTYISQFNPNHEFFRLYFPVNEELVSATTGVVKLYDCIYFGRLNKEKGVEDFIRVIAEIKITRPGIKGCILGSGNIKPFISLAKELGCSGNIAFIGFVKTQKELFEYVKASRVFLVPPYFERLSSTIREAMLLKVPIVAYATGGIPYVNEFDEHIYMVETGNYREMAQKTILLLEDEILSSQLAEKAFVYGNNEYSLRVNLERLLKAYQTILNNTIKQR